LDGYFKPIVKEEPNLPENVAPTNIVKRERTEEGGKATKKSKVTQEPPCKDNCAKEGTPEERKRLFDNVFGDPTIRQSIVSKFENPFNLLQLRGLLSMYALRILTQSELKDHFARRYLSMYSGLNLKSDEPVPYEYCKSIYMDLNGEWDEICDENCLEYEDDWTREDFEKAYKCLRYVPESVFCCGREGSQVWRVYNRGKFTDEDIYKEFECPEACINQACASGLPVAMVKKLFIKTGMPVTYQDQMDQSCLHHACLRGHYKLCRYLVGLGMKAKINLAYFADNVDGSTPLMKACISGNLKVVKCLVEVGLADVRHLDIYKKHCPLSLACRSNHVKIVEYLLQTGEVNVNRILKDVYFIPEMRKFSKETLLSIQVADGHTEIVKLLIEKGKAALEKKGCQGLTAFVTAAECGKLGIIKYMVEHCKVNLNSTDKKGRGAILYAAKRGNADVLKYLVESAKMDINVTDADGKSCLDYALESKHKETIEYVQRLL